LLAAVKVVVSVEALAKTSGAIAKTVLGADGLLLVAGLCGVGGEIGNIIDSDSDTVVTGSKTSVLRSATGSVATLVVDS